MEDNVSKIKDRLSVVDVISGYIKTQKAGINFKARCPFHNEKTPSFYISPERQIWHCFGCQKGGDMFTFVEEIEGIDFNGAIKILAAKAGVELERYNKKDTDQKTELYEISERACKFFEKQLYNSSAGKKALAYLLDRGLRESTLKEFRVGFAPDNWQALSQYLMESGFSAQAIVASGVAFKKDGKDEILDRFRSRITFPINDINGRIVGFSARIFGDNHPADVGKYINTPQTEIYDKSRILYGLDKAKMGIRSQGRALLVEGNIDVIMSYQTGVKNVVATSGTALTPSHLQLLQRYTSNLDFCFDTDKAGSIATRRGIGMALAKNLNVSIVQIPDPKCKDPADYVSKYSSPERSEGPSWSEVVLSGSRPAIDFYFEKSRKEFDLRSPSGKKAMLAQMAPLINRLLSEVERMHWVAQLATVMRTKEEAVIADLKVIPDDLAVYEPQSQEKVPAGGAARSLDETGVLNQSLLAVVLKKPLLFKEELGAVDHEILMPEISSMIQSIVNSGFSTSSIDATFNDLAGQTQVQIGSAYIRASELLKDFTDEDLKNEFSIIQGRLTALHRQHAIETLTADIREAEAIGDREKAQELAQRIHIILKNQTTH